MKPIDLTFTPWRRLTLSERHGIWCLVDADDYEWLTLKRWNWAWHARSPQRFYAKRNVGPARSTVYLHREVMLRVGPPPAPGLHVDHKNGQSLDNRKANLRWLTPKENIANKVPPFLIPSLDELLASLVGSLQVGAAA